MNHIGSAFSTTYSSYLHLPSIQKGDWERKILHTYIHTYMHAYIHTYLLIYLLTYLRTYLLTYLLTYLCTYVLTYVLTYSRTYVRTCLLTYLLTYIHTYLHTNIPWWHDDRFVSVHLSLAQVEQNIINFKMLVKVTTMNLMPFYSTAAWIKSCFFQWVVIKGCHKFNFC